MVCLATIGLAWWEIYIYINRLRRSSQETKGNAHAGGMPLLAIPGRATQVNTPIPIPQIAEKRTQKTDPVYKGSYM